MDFTFDDIFFKILIPRNLELIYRNEDVTHLDTNLFILDVESLMEGAREECKIFCFPNGVFPEKQDEERLNLELGEGQPVVKFDLPFGEWEVHGEYPVFARDYGCSMVGFVRPVDYRSTTGSSFGGLVFCSSIFEEKYRVLILKKGISCLSLYFVFKEGIGTKASESETTPTSTSGDITKQIATSFLDVVVAKGAGAVGGYIFDAASKYFRKEDVFQLVGVPLANDALAGYDTSVLAYGQTGSGKTYTMWCPPTAMVEDGASSGLQGLVSRIFQMLFSKIQQDQENSEGRQFNYQCRCSFLEIYNEKIGDLLDPIQRNLEIRDDPKNRFYVENLTEEYVTNYEEVTEILIKGLSSRMVGATSTNSKSSRSHIVFTCIIEPWCKEISSKCFGSSKSSEISLVDLTGFDDTILDDAGKQCLNEGKFVQNSTSQFGHLVNALVERGHSGFPEVTPYQVSCLTHLLRESLGGNAELSVICAISPDKNDPESKATEREKELECVCKDHEAMIEQLNQLLMRYKTEAEKISSHEKSDDKNQILPTCENEKCQSKSGENELLMWSGGENHDEELAKEKCEVIPRILC